MYVAAKPATTWDKDVTLAEIREKNASRLRNLEQIEIKQSPGKLKQMDQGLFSMIHGEQGTEWDHTARVTT